MLCSCGKKNNFFPITSCRARESGDRSAVLSNGVFQGRPIFHDDLGAETKGPEGTSVRTCEGSAFPTERPASTATWGGIRSGVFKGGALRAVRLERRPEVQQGLTT